MKKTITILISILLLHSVAAQNKIAGYEYWFDNNFAQKVSSTISPTDEFLFDKNISTEGLSDGLHQFNIRFVDNEAYWSSIYSQYFYKIPDVAPDTPSSLTQYEYWIDDDRENATNIALAGEKVIQIDQLISTDEIKNGLHQFNFRIKDNKGYWSGILTQFFYKLEKEVTIIDPTITTGRYWFDDDLDQAESIDIDEPQELYEWIKQVPMPYSMWSGEHQLYVQFKDNKGMWSAPFEHQFEKDLDPRGNIFADNEAVCGIEYVTFHSNAVDIDYIEWDFGDGTPIQTLAPDKSVKHSFAAAGEYRVKAKLIHEESETTIEKEITVNVYPHYGISEAILHQDNFEDGEIGSLPEGWVIRYNGTGDANQKIVIDPENENNKAFHLAGRSGWAANLSRYVDDIPSQVSLETRMYTMGIGDIRIGNPSHGSWGYYLGGVQYNNGSFICTNHGSSAGAVYNFDNLDENKWYTVRLDFDFDALKYKVFLDGVQLSGSNGGKQYNEFPVLPNTNPLSIELSSNSQMMYDDVKLFVGETNVLPPVDLTVCSHELPYQFGTQMLTESGSYEELFRTIHGCDSIVNINLTVLESPLAEITLTDNVLTATQEGASYQWLDCNNGYAEIENASERSFTPTASGSYAVRITMNDCSVVSECRAVNFSGVYKNSFSESIVVYPNPSRGNLNIDLGREHAELRLKLFNLEGQEIRQMHFSNQSKLQLDLDVDAGVYLLRIESGSEHATIKAVKY